MKKTIYDEIKKQILLRIGMSLLFLLLTITSIYSEIETKQYHHFVIAFFMSLAFIFFLHRSVVFMIKLDRVKELHKSGKIIENLPYDIHVEHIRYSKNSYKNFIPIVKYKNKDGSELILHGEKYISAKELFCRKSINLLIDEENPSNYYLFFNADNNYKLAKNSLSNSGKELFLFFAFFIDIAWLLLSYVNLRDYGINAKGTFIIVVEILLLLIIIYKLFKQGEIKDEYLKCLKNGTRIDDIPCTKHYIKHYYDTKEFFHAVIEYKAKDGKTYTLGSPEDFVTKDYGNKDSMSLLINEDNPDCFIMGFNLEESKKDSGF